MHKDMSPLWPFATGNAVLAAMPIGWLHVLCLASGLVGGLLIAMKAMIDRS